MILPEFRNYTETSLGKPFDLTLPYGPDSSRVEEFAGSFLPGEGERELPRVVLVAPLAPDYSPNGSA